MKLNETKNLKLQYVNRIETNSTHVNNIHGSDVSLTEKITEILNTYEKNPFSKVNHLSRNGVIFVEDTDRALPNVDKNNKITKTNHKSRNNQTNHSTNTRKRISQNIYISHKTDIVDQIAKITSIENNYSRSNSNRREIFDTSSHSNSRNRHYSNNRSRNSSYNRKKTFRITEIEVIQITETNVTKTTDQETIPITDLIIKETITITIIGHETTHKIGIPTITTKEIILNLLIETTIVTLIPNTKVEVTRQKISDK